MPGPFASLNGVTIVKGSIVVPFSGIWHADLVLDTETDVTGPLTLIAGDITGQCRRIRSIVEVGARGVRVVGGAGGWRQKIGPRQYRAGILLSVVVNDAANAATIDDSRSGVTTVSERVAVVDDRQLPAFCRKQDAAGWVLNWAAEGEWWMGFDGVTNIGPRITTPIVSTFTGVRVEGARGLFEIATEKLSDWTPGRTFQSPTVSGNISVVEHHIERGKLRTMVMAQ